MKISEQCLTLKSFIQEISAKFFPRKALGVSIFQEFLERRKWSFLIEASVDPAG